MCNSLYNKGFEPLESILSCCNIPRRFSIVTIADTLQLFLERLAMLVAAAIIFLACMCVVATVKSLDNKPCDPLSKTTVLLRKKKPEFLTTTSHPLHLCTQQLERCRNANLSAVILSTCGHCTLWTPLVLCRPLTTDPSVAHSTPCRYETEACSDGCS